MPASWIAVALASDLPAGVAIPARAVWGDLVVWRSASGVLSCATDRCPHRGMRLSHGFVRGELLSCIYHGWRYDTTGQCRKIPAHPDLEPPAAIGAGSFPCRESQGVIWVAETDPAESPPDLGQVEPLRTLTFDATAETIARAAGFDGSWGRAMLPGLSEPLTLVLQTLPQGTAVHVLMSPGTPPAAASRAFEAFRRQVEAQECAA